MPIPPSSIVPSMSLFTNERTGRLPNFISVVYSPQISFLFLWFVCCARNFERVRVPLSVESAATDWSAANLHNRTGGVLSYWDATTKGEEGAHRGLDARRQQCQGCRQHRCCAQCLSGSFTEKLFTNGGPARNPEGRTSGLQVEAGALGTILDSC